MKKEIKLAVMLIAIFILTPASGENILDKFFADVPKEVGQFEGVTYMKSLDDSEVTFDGEKDYLLTNNLGKGVGKKPVWDLFCTSDKMKGVKQCHIYSRMNSFIYIRTSGHNLPIVGVAIHDKVDEMAGIKIDENEPTFFKPSSIGGRPHAILIGRKAQIILDQIFNGDEIITQAYFYGASEKRIKGTSTYGFRQAFNYMNKYLELAASPKIIKPQKKDGVFHNHGSRSHKHPLPKVGLKHTHN